jgi:hypothetical protein
MSTVDTLFDVGQTAHVQWRVWQHSMHPRKAEQGQKAVQNADHQQVHVIRTTFFESDQRKNGLVWAAIGQTRDNRYLLHGLLTIAAAIF